MFRATIPLLRDFNFDENDLTNFANKTLGDSLNLLKVRSNITQKEIAQILNIFEITVKRNIKELKEKPYIIRTSCCLFHLLTYDVFRYIIDTIHIQYLSLMTFRHLFPFFNSI